MPSKPPQKDDTGNGTPRQVKRKGPPLSSNSSQNHIANRPQKRHKAHDARTIITQTSDAALADGALDLSQFLKSREFEIKALEDGMRRAKGALTTRAFQQVPRDMRRRTASHNVKRVPKRLQKRAFREMKEDNTPSVATQKTKTSTTKGRLRAETAKRLRILADKKPLPKSAADLKIQDAGIAGVKGRKPVPKARKGVLNTPAKANSKFRKRQIHKTWLPTHMWHAKRAKMTETKEPLWRFAIPITSTQKSYRPTHRSGSQRGAVCWDMSYMSTIGLEGSRLTLEKVLRSVGVENDEAWGRSGQKWREGKRAWSGWLHKSVGGRNIIIGPATVAWCAERQYTTGKSPVDVANGALDAMQEELGAARKYLAPKGQVMLRVHPSMFLDLWNELIRLSKMQRPVVLVEDLRFELGSIEVMGPASTEALVGVLQPFDENPDAHAKCFQALPDVSNPASLPPGALLSFSILDPRLRYPPLKRRLPVEPAEEASSSLLETLSTWPVDLSNPSTSLFDRTIRHNATLLPSQKALNRRKASAPPGSYPALTPLDPPIPIMIIVSRSTSSSTSQGSYTVIAPWKCIQPIWYSLMHYPLSSGGNPRFGGLQELQQVYFEQGTPWFPGDYLGTAAGWSWELTERERRKREWEARPKGKKTAFESLDLGAGRKGEVGTGWCCDFEKILSAGLTSLRPELSSCPGRTSSSTESTTKPAEASPILHLPKSILDLIGTKHDLADTPTAVTTVRITFLSRGVPQPCARIYRIPLTRCLDQVLTTSSAEGSKADGRVLPSFAPRETLRQQWLDLIPKSTKSKKVKIPHSTSQHKPLRLSTLASPAERHRAIAQSLLARPPLPYPPVQKMPDHPLVPDEEDLIGFVTTGNFNLAQGQGTAVGCLLLSKVTDGSRQTKDLEQRVCIVRNAGESLGRLGIWEAV